MDGAGSHAEHFRAIPPVTSDMTESADPFASKSNVRLTKVRLFVTGTKTAGGVLRTNLTHNGPETILEYVE